MRAMGAQRIRAPLPHWVLWEREAVTFRWAFAAAAVACLCVAVTVAAGGCSALGVGSLICNGASDDDDDGA